VRFSVWLAMKNQFHLAVTESSGKGDLHAAQFQSHFLLKLTSQRGFGLFVCSYETAGNSPATACSKDVFQQQDVTLFVHDDGAGADDESRVPKAGEEKTNAPGRQTKQQR